MTEYITELQVSLNDKEEKQFLEKGFSKCPVNLNQGAGGNIIYLWYNTGKGLGITAIQFSFNKEMTIGLKLAGYQPIYKNLNEGAGGDQIYLWYSTSDKNVPIVDIDVTDDVKDEVKYFEEDRERLACDLNRNTKGKPIYLFLKREKQTYIADIKATVNCIKDEDNFKNGYIRVDETTNRGVEGAPTIFLWYLLSTYPSDAFRDLKISTNQTDYASYQKDEYQLVNQDLNEGTKGNQVYLWYKKEGCDYEPIKAVTVINNKAVEPYNCAGAKVIEKSLNSGNKGDKIYLCFNQ